MTAAFVEGARAAQSDGAWATLAFLIREFGGVLRTAVRARRPDRWTLRTAPSSPEQHPKSVSSMIDRLLSDLRFAGRTFRRRPGMSLLTILTLSLGIGASTAMFSVVRTVLLKPLPYPQPDRLVSVYPGWPQMRGHATLGHMAERGTWSWPEYFGVAENQTVFEEIAAYEGGGVTITGDGPARRATGARVTWTLFPLLGATPAAGRLFNADDEGSVVVLSHAEWRDRFGSDPDAIGRSITLSGVSHEVIGVLPADFEVDGLEQADFWRPRVGSFTTEGLGNHGGTRAVARLAEGVTIEQAAAGMTSLFETLLPAEHGVHEGYVFPRQEDETRTARPVLTAMLAASLLLLLVGCGNAAAFLLGIGIDRERELAVRGALGANRTRIVSQLLTESSVLAALATVGGVLASLGLTNLLLQVAPDGVPGLGEARIDGFVLVFTTLTAIVFGVGFGLIPALSLASVDLAGAIGSLRTTRTKRARLQSAVVVSELALATVLAVVGVLLVRTVAALGDVDAGLDVDHLAAVAIAPPFERFRDEQGETDGFAMQAYLAELREEIGALPGVEGVALTSVPPLTAWRSNNGVNPDGFDFSDPNPIAERRFVSPDYFDVAGVEILSGRGFRPDESQDAEPWVVVVSEGLAEVGWNGEDPVGRSMSYWGRDATVIGVARNVRDESLEDVTELAFYAPGTPSPMLVRTGGDPATLIPTIRERIWAIDQDAPILVASSLPDLITAEIAEEQYRARIMSVFAILAGLLAMLGVYGVASRSVARRRKEIGIRLALGAARGGVWTLVSAEALKLAALGTAIGIGMAVLARPLFESFLWGVGATDPVTLMLVAISLPVVGLLAAAVPAHRATRVDPLEALQEE